MNAAVDLDNQLLFSAVEVGHELRYPGLPPELSVIETAIAQRVPQHLLTLSLALPESPRSTNQGVARGP